MLRKIKLLILSILLGLSYLSTSAQSATDTLVVYFRHDSADYDSTYMNNAQRLKAVRESIKELLKYPDFKVVKMNCFAAASPEGSVAHNENLSKRRTITAVNLLRESFDLPDSIYTHTTITEDWDLLAEAIEHDNRLQDKELILKIIRETDDDVERERKIRAYSQKSWDYLKSTYFQYLRALRVYVYMTYNLPVPDAGTLDVKKEVIEEEVVEFEPISVEIPQVAPRQISNKKLTLKTNLLGWSILGANVAVEYDITPHLSIALPIHYSGGVEYKETLKFRGFALQPELRYYPWLNNERNQGFFIGLHGGVAWFNIAVNGDFRYQDMDGERPAYGGGLGLGYSFRFGKNTRWGMEVSVGGGVYDAMYDVFYNEPNGPYYSRGNRTLWFGMDNASVSLFYKFDTKKRGGKN